MSNNTPRTVVRATQEPCPACEWTTLNHHTVGAISATAAHTRDEHPAISARRNVIPEDASQRIPADWNFATVDAVTAPTAGQLALYPTS